MTKIKQQSTIKETIVIEAKTATKDNPARIVVRGKGHYKSIPVVFFTEQETSSLLEIVDKVERDTHDKILYKR